MAVDRNRPRLGIGPAATPKLQWEHELGAVISATPTIVSLSGGADGPLGPGVADESVAYVGTHAGRIVGVVVDGTRKGTMVLDRTVDGIIWRRAAWDEAGRLYFGADDDHLYALDLGTGDRLWRVRLGNCTPPRAPGPEGVRCDVDGGPTIGPSGDLYVGADGVYRIGTDGTIKWHTPDAEAEAHPAHVYSIPLVTQGGRVVFGGYNGRITAVSAEDGSPAWSVEVGADVDGSAIQTKDGTIVIGADDGKLYALSEAGQSLWTFQAERDIRAAAALGPDDSLFVPSFDGQLYALDPLGVARWILPTSQALAATPAIDRDGNLYVGGRDDRLYGLAAAGDVRWNVELPGDLDSGVAVSPEGTLVFGCDDGTLRAVH